LKASIRDNNPVVFIEQKLLYRTKGEVPVDQDDYLVELGVADVKREGTDVTIVTYGRMVQRALEAAEIVAEKGISVEVVDPRTLVPLDKDAIIKSVAKTGKMIVVVEAAQTGSFAGELIATVTESDAFDYLDAPIQRLCGKDVPIPYNPNLEAAVVPQVDEIVAAIEKAVNRG
jgi:pyruvate dehydrogenase E1 component beta subunit